MQTTVGQPTLVSILFFFIFISITLYITYLAAKRTKTTTEFYAAARQITGFQNGVALAGDYMSAASFLGIAGMVALTGFDGMIYATGWLVGWPIMLFLIAEQVRNLGKYTFGDVVAYRLRNHPVRIAVATSGILVVLCYLIPQMVGSGTLIRLLFGLPYEVAVCIVGLVMLTYVLFGGMIATTWVQIIKAGLLIGGVTLMMLIAMANFGFNPVKLYAAVSAKYGSGALLPGGLVKNPVDAVSLGIALMLGVLGLPHILMRFYTVPDAKEARKSIVWATGCIGYFYLMIPIVGFCAAALVGRESITSIDKGGNMSAPLLAEFVGGPAFLGFISAVAFATILAVVAGLTLAGASALAHDLYTSVVKGGKATEAEQMRVARFCTLAIGILAILLGIAFKGQNVAFLVGLVFAVACSANFPALFLSIVWKRLTTTGAVASIIVGATAAIILIILSPTVWVAILKNPSPVFPLSNPAIISMPLAFITAYVASIVSPDKESEEKFTNMRVRTYLGIGAE